jgi:mono/diheme cytochrome c family protein
VERGRRIAERLGCFACHGPGGEGGVPNPGSEEEEVPAWSGGMVMMYALNEAEIREWILDGAPRRLREQEAHEEEHERALLRMPAYRGRLSEEELNDLVAYFKAVSWFETPPSELAARGREVAFEKGCFGCHGPSGMGRLPNPGSFKGYIPGWDGPDFRELVRDERELEEWILEGISRRFRSNPAAQFFLKRQAIKMPAYRGHLTDEELEALKAYIRWVQETR